MAGTPRGCLSSAAQPGSRKTLPGVRSAGLPDGPRPGPNTEHRQKQEPTARLARTPAGTRPPSTVPPGPPHKAEAHNPPRVSGVFLLPDSRGSPLCHRHLHNLLLLPEQVWSIPHPPPWLTQSQTGHLLHPPTPLHTGPGPSALPNHRCSLAFTPL